MAKQQLIGKQEKEAIQKGELVWKKSLRMSYERWRLINGIVRTADMADILGIPERQHRSIAGAESVSAERENYCLLFSLTNLTEADPRHIPPRIASIGKSGVYLIPRAMGEEEWQSWLRKNETRCQQTKERLEVFKTTGKLEKQVITKPQVVKPIRSPLPTTAPRSTTPSGTVASLESFIDGIVDKAVERLADQLLARIENKLPGIVGQQKQTNTDPGQLARGLRATLLHGSSQDRERLYQKYADPLLDLFPILDAFINSKDQNELEAKLRIMSGK